MQFADSPAAVASFRSAGGQAYILKRNSTSVEEALASTSKPGAPALALCKGRGAVFRFLRLSLRLHALPALLPAKAAFRARRHLHAEPGGRLAAEMMGLGEESRDAIDALERGRSIAQWNAREDALLRVYFGHRDSAATADADEPPAVQLIQTPAMSTAMAQACLQEALQADAQLLVADFAARHFNAMRVGASTVDTAITSSLLPLPSMASPHLLPQPADQGGADLSHLWTLASLRQPHRDDRMHVGVNSLPSRRTLLDALVQAALLPARRSAARPAHALVVVSGPAGIGKSGFLQECLLHLRDLHDAPFSEVLYVTAAAHLAEDALVAEVREHLASSTACPLIVLDGLRIQGDELAWHTSPHGQQGGDGGLCQLLASQIGQRPFAALLGVQTSPINPCGVPARLRQHPRQPLLALAEELRLQPLPADEGMSFAREIMAPPAPRDDDLQRLAAWSGGLPLLLSAAAALPRNPAGGLELPGSAVNITSAGAADRMWHQLRSTLEQLNALDGEHHAVMRLLSLFRRPQSDRFIRDVVAAVQHTGLQIKRIHEQALQLVLTRSRFLSQGPGGRVQLHEGVRHIISQELADVLHADAEMAVEVRAIHLAASGLCYQQWRARGGPGYATGEQGAGMLPRTRQDLELICDCVHHLLGTRGSQGSGVSATGLLAGAWADDLDEAGRRVFCGLAGDDEIEHFCYRKLLGRRLIEGHTFSDQGLFAHKLSLLYRFTEVWSGEPTGRPAADQLRRNVRRELGACSVVAGRLEHGANALQQVLHELGQMTGAAQRAQLRQSVASKRQPESDPAVHHCVELSKATAIRATALLRMGHLQKARTQLEAALRNAVEPLEAALRQPVAAQLEDAARDQLAQVQLAHARLLVRLAEVSHLSTPLSKPGPGGALAGALSLFEQAHALHEAHERRRFAYRADAAEPRSAVHPSGGLSGESARAHIRCMLAASQLAGPDTRARVALLQQAHQLVERHLPSQNHGIPAGWSNDAIGFGLLQATLGLLKGRLDDAAAALEEIGRHPRYLYLGACSQAMKFELRLTHAKLALAHAPDAMPASRAGLCAELDDVARHAEDTRHHLLQLDALLLLAIASPPAQSDRYLEQARTVCENVRHYQARDDVFAWFDNGRPSPWLQLTLAI